MNSQRNKRARRVIAAQKLIVEAGAQDDPYCREMLAWVGSPIDRTSEKFFHRLDEHLVHRTLMEELNPRSPVIPRVSQRSSVVLGYVGNQELRVSLEDLSRGLMELGPMGSGKTTHGFWVATQLIDKDVGITLMDHKNEGRRLMKHLQDRVLILRPADLWFNPLAPIGNDNGAFYGAFAQELGAVAQMHPGTVMKVAQTLRQLSCGAAPGDPHPSLQDLWLTLEHRAKTERDTTFRSAATSLRNLEPFFGRATRLRENRRSPSRYSVIALECLGLPPRIVRFIAGVFLNRLQHETRTGGHRQTGLDRVYLSDEGSFEFSAQFADTGSSTYLSPYRKLFTQARSSRTCVAVGFQTLGQADAVVKSNAGVFICHRATGSAEQREAASLLGLPLERAPELGTLPLGKGYLRAPGYPQPIPFAFPPFDLGDYLSDQEVERVMRPRIEDLLADAVYASPEGDGGSLSYRVILGEDAIEDKPADEERAEEAAEPAAPLTEIVTSDTPMSDWSEFLLVLRRIEPVAVTVLYRTLGCSTGRGNRLKNALLGHRLIAEEKEASISKKGGRPRKFLTLTTRGHEFIAQFGPNQQGASE